jgi:ribosomal protein S18
MGGTDIKFLKKILAHTIRCIPKCQTGLMTEQAERLKGQIKDAERLVKKNKKHSKR